MGLNLIPLPDETEEKLTPTEKQVKEILKRVDKLKKQAGTRDKKQRDKR